MLSYKIASTEFNVLFKDDNDTLCRSHTEYTTNLWGNRQKAYEVVDYIITKTEFHAMMDAWYDEWCRQNLFNIK